MYMLQVELSLHCRKNLLSAVKSVLNDEKLKKVVRLKGGN